MGVRSEHAPGTFSWVDLTTNDAEGAKEFYGGLLGWDFEDNEIPDGGGVYTMCRVGGESVAAIAPETDRLPPHWNSYVTVESADDVVLRVAELAGTVIEDPFDVMEAGRMAVLQDPTGAMVCAWEPREAIGATRVNDPGCLTWNELHTPDPAAALEFYVGLFGWATEEMPAGGGPAYTIVRVGERSNGGVMGTQEGEPPNWLPYFTVESRDAAAAKATELGAMELHRMEMPQGSIAIFTDPQSAPFALFEGEVDD
jgi:predicted enzyme related to lactoylglutathione lyase